MLYLTNLSCCVRRVAFGLGISLASDLFAGSPDICSRGARDWSEIGSTTTFGRAYREVISEQGCDLLAPFAVFGYRDEILCEDGVTMLGFADAAIDSAINRMINEELGGSLFAFDLHLDALICKAAANDSDSHQWACEIMSELSYRACFDGSKSPSPRPDEDRIIAGLPAIIH